LYNLCKWLISKDLTQWSCVFHDQLKVIQMFMKYIVFKEPEGLVSIITKVHHLTPS